MVPKENTLAYSCQDLVVELRKSLTSPLNRFLLRRKKEKKAKLGFELMTFGHVVS